MLPDHTPFLTVLFRRLEVRPGALDHLFLDHICFRVETVERYITLRDELSQQSHQLLVEGIIGGRRISTFKLAQPLRYQDRLIPLLELPEPKAGSFYAEGYEHVEFVTDRPLPEFISHLSTLLAPEATDIDHQGLTKSRNADLRVRLGDGYNVKFHERSLEEVIKEELEERS